MQAERIITYNRESKMPNLQDKTPEEYNAEINQLKKKLNSCLKDNQDLKNQKKKLEFEKEDVTRKHVEFYDKIKANIARREAREK